MKRNEGRWWIGGFLLGLAVGLGLSLLYTWVLDPLPMGVSTAAALNPHDKEVYTVLVAAAYSTDGDLDRAKKRLAQLEDLDIENTIVVLAERYVKEDRDLRDVRAMARLADALGQSSAAVRPFLATLTVTPTASPTATPVPPTKTATRPAPTRTQTPIATKTATRSPASPTPTRTSTSTRTATPTRTATAQPDLFQVVQSTALCGEEEKEVGLLRVYVRDGDNQPVEGAQVLVNWPNGSDQFYTGFQSELDPGYADFEMEPGEIYQVELANLKSEIARDVGGPAAELCPDLPENARPSWQVVFQLP